MAFPARCYIGRRLRHFKLDSAATYTTGAAVILDAQQELTEAAATPTTILGFSSGPTTRPGIDPNPGYGIVEVATPDNSFIMEIWASAARVQPAETDIGVAYGIAKDAGNGAWYVNRDDTTTTCVTVIGIHEAPENSAEGSFVQVKVNTPVLGA